MRRLAATGIVPIRALALALAVLALAGCREAPVAVAPAAAINTPLPPPSPTSAAVAGAEVPSTAQEAPTAETEPSPAETPSPAPQPAAPVQSTEAIIADHTCTDISRIPPEWLAKAKELTLHYAFTSHGSQIVTGLQWLASRQPDLAVAVHTSKDRPALPKQAGALRIYDGNPPELYIQPDDYWASPEGLARTQAVVDTGLFDLSMWSWCAEQGTNDEATVRRYLEALDELERRNPGMRFIYMTGRTEGNNETVLRNNELVREYVREHGKVLFDFADIESYDPAGNHYPEARDICNWCPDWCEQHPEDCAQLDSMSKCAHAHPLLCKVKAQAFWWLLARLAGWDGK